MTTRLWISLSAPYRLWRSDRGAVPLKDVIAIAAVGIILLAAVMAVLQVVGVDVDGWLREQFGVAAPE